MIRLAARHPDWALGFADEVWWSRVSQPDANAWVDEQPLRLLEQTVARDDPDPKALAAYGLLGQGAGGAEPEVWLRFVTARPVSGATTAFLDWCCAGLAAWGKTALLFVWDNASWHLSKAVRGWLRRYNRTVKAQGEGVRIIACFLPTKSPWLNPIEPRWVHGKRRVAEPARLLTAAELEQRVCDAFGCDQLQHLAIPEEAA
ncbi:MAG TPA: transposase [Dehalococcoidia bacterium]|nr:transposase [Dehalococcoidia bacterium]